MTKDQITAWAREAGFSVDEASRQYQPKCIEFTHYLIDDELERFAALVAAAEREACAKVCEAEAEKQYDNMDIPLTIAADLIRARGNT